MGARQIQTYALWFGWFEAEMPMEKKQTTQKHHLRMNQFPHH